jgi:hypothetical protein
MNGTRLLEPRKGWLNCKQGGPKRGYHPSVAGVAGILKTEARKSPGLLPFFNRLQLVTESAVITAFESAFLALPFACFYQVFQATRPLHGRLTALRAPLVPLHAQLIFSLARNGQRREFVFDAFSHFIPFPTGQNISRNNLYITLDRFRPNSFDCQTFWRKREQSPQGLLRGGVRESRIEERQVCAQGTRLP